jgi:hypothetical protein
MDEESEKFFLTIIESRSVLIDKVYFFCASILPIIKNRISKQNNVLPKKEQENTDCRRTSNALDI